VALQFILGRAGSGKTHYCLEAIRTELRQSQRGPTLVLLVPEQATYQMERALVTTAGLGGYCRAHVLSFRRLAWHALQEVGGAALPPLDATGKQMILRSIVRRRAGDLRLFAKSARQRGFATRLALTLGEMHSYSHWANQLRAEFLRLEQRGEGDSLLAAKIHDLAIVAEEYERFLAQRFADPDSYLDLLAARMGRKNRFHGARVWIDGFASFTGQEERVLAALMAVAAEIRIALCLDPEVGSRRREARSQKLEVRDQESAVGDKRDDELSMFALLRETYERLKGLALDSGQMILSPLTLPQPNQPTRFAESNALTRIESQLFSVQSQKSKVKSQKSEIQSPEPNVQNPESEIQNPKSKIQNEKAVCSVSLTAAADQRSEVHDVACEILRLCREEGYRFRDIAVIVRDFAPYRALIETIFNDSEIPHFIDVRRDVAHHPAVELIRAALAVVARKWPSPEVIRYAKTDLVAPERSAVDLLENYVMEHGVEGAAWWDEKPWRWGRRSGLDEESEAADEAPLERINAWRLALVGPLRRFENAIAHTETTVANMTRALYGLLDELRVADRLERWAGAAEAARRLSEADEHRQVWDAIVALFDQAVAALGADQVGLDEYRDIIEAGLEGIRLRLVPPALDQVLVGSIERSRHPEVRVAFVLGLNERIFPQAQLPDVIFGDREREALAHDKLRLGPVSEKRLLHEQFLAYIAFTRPSERLYVSYAKADPMGKVLHPSPYVDELRRAACDDIALREVGGQEVALQHVSHWRAALSALCAAMGSGDQVVADGRAAWIALYGAMLRDGRLCGELKRRVGGLVYDNRAALSQQITRRLHGDVAESSVSRLETFAACPFKHFARYGLGLEERRRFRLERYDLGLLYHAVLRDVFERLSGGEALDWAAVEPDRAMAAVEDALGRLALQLRSEILLSSARHRYVLEAARASLKTFVRVLIERARREGFRQVAAEVSFGRGEATRYGPVEIALGAEGRLLLRGRIDRIDRAVCDPSVVRIIDYKSGGRDFSLNELINGLTLQLPAYLLALERGSAGRGAQVKVAGALYLPILRRTRAAAPSELATESKSPGLDLKAWKARGPFDARWMALFDAETARSGGSSPIVSLRINKDGNLSKYEQDALPQDALASLLRWTERSLADLGRKIASGRVEVHPYQLATERACQWCDFGAFCRFEARRQPYNILSKRSQKDALEFIISQRSEVRS